MSQGGRDAQTLLDETARAAAEALLLEELRDGALEPLRRALGASGLLLYRFDAHGRPEGVAGNLVEALGVYTPELLAEDPVQSYLQRHYAGPQRGAVQAVRQLGPRTYRGSAAYEAFYRPFEMEHLLGFALDHAPYGAPGMSGLLLTRARREADFAPDAEQLIAAAQPHLAAVARREARLDEETRRRRGMEALLLHHVDRPHLVLDATGTLLFASPPAAPLVALLPGGVLPDPLVDGARRLSALVRHGVATSPDAYRFELSDGRALRAELLPVRTSDGGLCVDVALEVLGLAAADLLRARERWGLTRAEAGVLGLLANGLTNAEIARRSCVSVETVRTHVQRVLGKLGVPTRQEAAALVRGG